MMMRGRGWLGSVLVALVMGSGLALLVPGWPALGVAGRVRDGSGAPTHQLEPSLAEDGSLDAPALSFEQGLAVLDLHARHATAEWSEVVRLTAEGGPVRPSLRSAKQFLVATLPCEGRPHAVRAGLVLGRLLRGLPSATWNQLVRELGQGADAAGVLVVAASQEDALGARSPSEFRVSAEWGVAAVRKYPDIVRVACERRSGALPDWPTVQEAIHAEIAHYRTGGQQAPTSAPELLQLACGSADSRSFLNAYLSTFATLYDPAGREAWVRALEWFCALSGEVEPVLALLHPRESRGREDLAAVALDALGRSRQATEELAQVMLSEEFSSGIRCRAAVFAAVTHPRIALGFAAEFLRTRCEDDAFRCALSALSNVLLHGSPQDRLRARRLVIAVAERGQSTRAEYLCLWIIVAFDADEGALAWATEFASRQEDAETRRRLEAAVAEAARHRR